MGKVHDVDHLQELDDQAHALERFASQIFIDGIVAFGWSYNELAATCFLETSEQTVVK